MGQCLKKCYSSRKKAKQALKNIKRNLHHALTRVYYCKHCSAYHVTSQTQRNK